MPTKRLASLPHAVAHPGVWSRACETEASLCFACTWTATDGMLLDTFVHERRHKLLKRVGTTINVGKDFERGVLARALQNDLCLLEEQSKNEDGSLGAKTVWPEMSRALNCPVTVAEHVNICGSALNVEDVIFGSGNAAVIMACLTAFQL